MSGEGSADAPERASKRARPADDGLGAGASTSSTIGGFVRTLSNGRSNDRGRRGSLGDLPVLPPTPTRSCSKEALPALPTPARSRSAHEREYPRTAAPALRTLSSLVAPPGTPLDLRTGLGSMLVFRGIFVLAVG